MVHAIGKLARSALWNIIPHKNKTRQLIAAIGSVMYRLTELIFQWFYPGNTKGGKYDCTIDLLLFDWFRISFMTTDDFCFYLPNRLIQTSQTGGQRYGDTSPFSTPWFYPAEDGQEGEEDCADDVAAGEAEHGVTLAPRVAHVAEHHEEHEAPEPGEGHILVSNFIKLFFFGTNSETKYGVLVKRSSLGRL